MPGGFCRQRTLEAQCCFCQGASPRRPIWPYTLKLTRRRMCLKTVVVRRSGFPFFPRVEFRRNVFGRATPRLHQNSDPLTASVELRRYRQNRYVRPILTNAISFDGGDCCKKVPVRKPARFISGRIVLILTPQERGTNFGRLFLTHSWESWAFLWGSDRPFLELWRAKRVPPRRLTEKAGQEAQRQAAATTPMRRIATADEVAATVLWLCSGQASFITGATVPVDGGQFAGVKPAHVSSGTNDGHKQVLTEDEGLQLLEVASPGVAVHAGFVRSSNLIPIEVPQNCNDESLLKFPHCFRVWSAGSGWTSFSSYSFTVSLSGRQERKRL